MNERIKELAEQAGLYHQVNDNNFYPTALSAEQSITSYNKFAELIVQECADACLHDDWEDPRWGRFYANKTKEHF